MFRDARIRRHLITTRQSDADRVRVAGRILTLPETQGHAHAKPWAWHPAEIFCQAATDIQAGMCHCTISLVQMGPSQVFCAGPSLGRLSRSEIFPVTRRRRSPLDATHS